MKQTVIAITLLVALITIQHAQDPKQIVRKCIDGLGGEMALAKYDNLEAEGRIKLTYGQMKFEGKVKSIRKGKKLWNRIEVGFGGRTFVVFEAFDGKTGWRDLMNNIATQPALNYKNDQAHSLKLLIQKKAVFSIGKQTEIEGRKVIGVDIAYLGKKTTILIDQTSYLPVEIQFTDTYYSRKEIQELVEKRIRFQHFIKIGNIMYPMKQTIFKKGKKDIEINFSKVSFDPKITSDIFARPDQAMDLRYAEEMLN